jgi:hypothetical protein
MQFSQDVNIAGDLNTVWLLVPNRGPLQMTRYLMLFALVACVASSAAAQGVQNQSVSDHLPEQRR